MPWQSQLVHLTAAQKKQLKKVADDEQASERERMRALIVLLLGAGLKNKEIAQRLNIHENTVVKWRGRWKGDNKDAKVEDYGELTGRPRSVLLEPTLQRIRKTASKPPKNALRWTVRSLAKEVKLPVATVHRALREMNIDLVEINKG